MLVLILENIFNYLCSQIVNQQAKFYTDIKILYLKISKCFCPSAIFKDAIQYNIAAFKVITYSDKMLECLNKQLIYLCKMNPVHHNI